MEQNIASAALAVMPNCRHTIILEEPDEFNRLAGDFIVQLQRPGAMAIAGLSSSITGIQSYTRTARARHAPS